MNGTNVTVNQMHSAAVPKGIVESRMRVSPHQMNIISILLAEIGKKTDDDDNRVYRLTAQDFADLQQLTDTRAAERIFRERICENNKSETSMRHIGIDIFIDSLNFEHYNWFSSVTYKDGVATFVLTPEMKRYLVEFKHSDQYRIYAKLKYILPMKSQYSKRIYLMCREFISSGVRYCDNDWETFTNKLKIPKSYRYAHIKSRVLQTAIDEINALSDITVEYTINEENTQGGKVPKSIVFTIKRKANMIDTDEDFEEDVESKSLSELELELEKIQKAIEQKKQAVKE